MANKEAKTIIDTSEFEAISSELDLISLQNPDINIDEIEAKPTNETDPIIILLNKFTDNNDVLFGVEQSEIRAKQYAQRQKQITIVKKNIETTKRIDKLDETVKKTSTKIGWSKSLIIGVIIEILIGTFFIIWTAATVFAHDWYYTSFYTDILNINAPERAIPLSICILKLLTSILIVVFAIVFAAVKTTWARAVSSSLIIFQMIVTMFNYSGIWLSLVIWMPVAFLVIFGKTIYEYEKIRKYYNIANGEQKSPTVVISDELDQMSETISKAHAFKSIEDMFEPTKDQINYKRNKHVQIEEEINISILGSNKINTVEVNNG